MAKENSTDPSAKTNAGDLGFFKKSDMLPEFADAAFALKPGEITQAPVQDPLRLPRHQAPRAPHGPGARELAQVHDEIRQALIQEGVTKVLAEAKQGLAVQKFNQDGTPLTDDPSSEQLLCRSCSSRRPGRRNNPSSPGKIDGERPWPFRPSLFQCRTCLPLAGVRLGATQAGHPLQGTHRPRHDRDASRHPRRRRLHSQ